MKKNILVRLPVTMEDEGELRICMEFDNFEQVNAWLEENNHVDGYYTPGDFVYIGTGATGENKYGIKQIKHKDQTPVDNHVVREPHITITVEKYNELLRDQIYLRELEERGGDWYREAMSAAREQHKKGYKQ